VFNFQNSLVQRFGRILSALLILVLIGLFARPLEMPAWRVIRVGQSEMNLDVIEGALGQGLVIGVFGGFRAILADFLWIRANIFWERRDQAKLDAMIRLVTAIDPRPVFFWTNASRMLAYDVPNWRIIKEGGYGRVSEKRQRVIDLEQAEQAFELIEKALIFHPNNANFYLEKAQIYLNRLKDDASAAKWFLLASQQEDAPFYAARIHAELLRKQGLNADAYEFLKSLYIDLPDDPYAQKGVILERIKELEKTLEIPIAGRFRP
jgi:tetratricopeptide (TPR) repeat protein